MIVCTSSFSQFLVASHTIKGKKNINVTCFIHACDCQNDVTSISSHCILTISNKANRKKFFLNESDERGT